MDPPVGLTRRGPHGALPTLALLLVVALGATRALGAAEPVAQAPAQARAGGGAAVPDSAQVAPAHLDTARTDSVCLPSPRGALLRSAMLPGWGQLDNHRPLKAIFCAGASAGVLAAAVSSQRSLSGSLSSSEYQDRAARRNTWILLYAACVTFSALDAYVDAQLAAFPPDPGQAALAPRAGGVGLCLRLPLPVGR